MTNATPRLGIPYPEEGVRTWFDTFDATMDALEAFDVAAIEARNLIFFGGGEFSWDLDSSTLTWDADLLLSSPGSGRLQTLPAGSVVLAEGQFFVVVLSVMPSSPVALTPETEAVIPPGTSAVALAIRAGGVVYFRTGLRLGDGDSGSPFAFQGGGGGDALEDAREAFDGDGMETDYLLADPPVGIPLVFLNGVLQEGGAVDYTLGAPDGRNLSFEVAPPNGARVIVQYRKEA